MIPFPFLRRDNKEKYNFLCVLVRQIGKSTVYKRGYYRIENDMLIGKNGRISVEEFMKEVAGFWKNSEINIKYIAGRNAFGIFFLFHRIYCEQGGFWRENTIIKLSRNRIGFPDFLPRDICCFLNKENFFRAIPLLLFDDEQCIKNIRIK